MDKPQLKRLNCQINNSTKNIINYFLCIYCNIKKHYKEFKIDNKRKHMVCKDCF